jgi:hypothetical protein
MAIISEWLKPKTVCSHCSSKTIEHFSPSTSQPPQITPITHKVTLTAEDVIMNQACNMIKKESYGLWNSPVSPTQGSYTMTERKVNFQEPNKLSLPSKGIYTLDDKYTLSAPNKFLTIDTSKQVVYEIQGRPIKAYDPNFSYFYPV